MDKKISLIIPFYNEEDNVDAITGEALRVLADISVDYEIIAVNDGSSDETRYLLDKLAKKNRHVRPVHHKKNMGYGAALRSGFEAASGGYVLTVDGDGQFYLDELKEIVKRLKDCKVVLGCRIDRKDPFIRKLNSMIYNWFARILVGVRIRDINCAMKGFDRSVLAGIKYRTSGAIINSDILSQILSRGIKFREIAVNHKPRVFGRQTGARLGVIANAMKEFINVFLDEFPKRKKELFFNFRILIGFIFAAALILLANPSDTKLFRAGMVIAAVGVFARNWASGYLKKSKVLCKEGPYSLVRHPLYFGSTLTGIGAIVSLWNRDSLAVSVIFAALFLGIFIFVYIPKIISEENNLMGWFGKEYAEYKKNVGLLFPRVKKPDLYLGGFRWSTWKKNKEYNSVIGLIIFYGVMIIKRHYF